MSRHGGSYSPSIPHIFRFRQTSNHNRRFSACNSAKKTSMFKEATRRWVDAECPKAWCRELERKEHQYPQLLGQADRGGHGIGIRGGIRRPSAATSSRRPCSCGSSPATPPGSGWIWGITSFSGATPIRLLHGTRSRSGGFSALMAAGQAEDRDGLHRAGRRHRPARRH